MAGSTKKLPKEFRNPKEASLVLEIRAKNGSPIRQKDKFRIRKAMRQFLRSASHLND